MTKNEKLTKAIKADNQLRAFKQKNNPKTIRHIKNGKAVFQHIYSEDAIR